MAKGRKIVSNRMLGYGHGNGHHAEGVPDMELGEEEVWSMIDDAVDRNDDFDFDQLHLAGSNELTSAPAMERSRPRGRSSRSQRWIDPQDRQMGGLSLAFDDVTRSTTSPRIVHQFHDTKAPQRGRHVASSAPMNVPNWGAMYRLDSADSMHDSDEGYDSERIPPHEYLARSRKSAATSVFEGVGRTLKGRDMSRVRDAVWSQTGFDG